MIRAPGRQFLLDIEGTTSSVRFVYDELFPFARRRLAAFLAESWGDDQVRAACELIARDAGFPSLDAWQAASNPLADAGPSGEGPSAKNSEGGASAGENSDGEAAARRLVQAEVERLMDGDVKATGLKELQGLIWKAGFESGQLRAHLYDDVAPALTSWQQAGCQLRIYSSGSVAAQKLFFSHTVQGDLLPLLSGHFDTKIGSKREAASYRLIAQSIGGPPGEILFLSDVVAELDAARQAGLATALSLRPGNAPVPAGHGHPELRSFAEIALPDGLES